LIVFDTIGVVVGLRPLSAVERTQIRVLANANRNEKIEVNRGGAAPRLSGKEEHFVTAHGRVIQYPSVYRLQNGSVVFVPSTRCVRVGAAWIARWRESHAGT
jgi:hypothetical protein